MAVMLCSGLKGTGPLRDSRLSRVNTVLETEPGDVTPYEYFLVSLMLHFGVWLPFNCFHLRLAFETAKP